MAAALPQAPLAELRKRDTDEEWPLTQYYGSIDDLVGAYTAHA